MIEPTSKEWPDAKVEQLLVAFSAMLAGHVGGFVEREAAALRLANEVARRWVEQELQAMASRYPDEVEVGRQRYRRHTSGVRRYHSLCGSVAVRRHVYRQIGVHNGPTVVPLEMEAGLLENATPALATSVSQAFATMPLRHYEAEMKAAHRAVPSRSTLERIGKRVGVSIHEELPVLEPTLRARSSVPSHAHSISVGLDRTTMPMAEPAGTDRRLRDRPYVRRAPAPVTVAYRMAYVATIAINDRDGQTIATTRLAATAGDGPNELMERFGAELQHLRSLAPTLPVIVIQDGAPELWALVEEWLATYDVPVAMQLIDRYHVDERLGAVAAAVEPDPKRAARLLARWRRSLDVDCAAAVRIWRRLDYLLHGPRRLDREAWPIERCQVRPQHRRVVDDSFGYFVRNASRMNYARARRRGFPVGSGVTEGACKSVIAARFKRSGQRWFESGAAPCLLLRTLHLNDRLESSIDLYSRFRHRSLVC